MIQKIGRGRKYIEIGENYVNCYSLAPEKNALFILSNMKRKLIKTTIAFEDIIMNKGFDFRGSNFVIFEGEELYIKKITFPAVSSGVMNRMIDNELNHMFSNIKDLTYTYKILSRDKREIQLLVYCINSEKNNLLRYIGNKSTIKAVYLVQLCILSALIPKITDESFTAVIMYNNIIYIIGCYKKDVIACRLIRYFDGNMNELLFQVEYVIERIKEINELRFSEKGLNLYLVNIDSVGVSEHIKKQYNCMDLGVIDIGNIIDKL